MWFLTFYLLHLLQLSTWMVKRKMDVQNILIVHSQCTFCAKNAWISHVLESSEICFQVEYFSEVVSVCMLLEVMFMFYAFCFYSVPREILEVLRVISSNSICMGCRTDLHGDQRRLWCSSKLDTVCPFIE